MSDNNKITEKLRFIDLFCGLGGTRLGLEQACEELGIECECVLSSDKKPASQTAYKHNFGEDIEGDICKIDEKKMPDFDVLLGGFPCFVAGTKVRTDKGYAPIEDIRPGDMVLTHKSRYRKVLSVGSTENADTVFLEGCGSHGRIECTPYHPFYARKVAEEIVENPGPREINGYTIHPSKEIRYHYSKREWVYAEDMTGLIWFVPWAPDADAFGRALPAGGVWGYERDDSDEVVGWWGKCESVESSGRKATVYNMEVEEDHSYTANGIAVSNCQAFSRAGKRRGFADTRGTMFFEIERIVREKKPKYILLENVPELMTHDKGNTFAVIKGNLETLGYSVSAKVLDASDFGVAQKRRRTFICAVLDSPAPDMEAIEKADEKKTISDIMEDDVPVMNDSYTTALLATREASSLTGYIITDKRRGDKTLHSWDFGMKGKVTADEKHVLETLLSEHRKREYAEELGVRWRDGMPLNEEQLSRATGFSKKKLRPLLDHLTDMGYLMRKHPYCDDSLDERTDLPQGWKLITARVHFPIHRILSPDEASITLTATDAQHIGVVDGEGIRKLTVREGLRLFGFSEDYDLSCVNEEKAFDLIGNSICVPVVEAVAKNMLAEENKSASDG